MRIKKILSVLFALALAVQGFSQGSIRPFVFSACISNDTATVVFGYQSVAGVALNIPNQNLLTNYWFLNTNPLIFPSPFPPTTFYPGTHTLPPISFPINQGTEFQWRLENTASLTASVDLTQEAELTPSLKVSDEDGNLLMAVNDHGSAGSINLPPIIGGPNCLDANTLSNLDGRLHFGAIDLMNHLCGGSLEGHISSMNVGNVGIGKGSPTERLHVNGNIRANGNVGIGTNFFGPQERLHVNGNIRADGNVGIGTSSPNARLDVAAVSGQPSIVTRGGRDYAVTAGQFLDMGHWDGTTFINRFSISPSGIANFTGQLQVDDVPFGDFLNVQWRASDGQFFQDNSSRRFKRNIQPLKDDFHLILKAQPKIYTRPLDSCRWEVSYIAEEMDNLGLEKLVSYDSLGIPDGFNYEKMILYVNEILKEHHSEIALLRTENTELTSVVSEMKNDFSFLKYLILGLLACAGLFLLFKIRKSFSIPVAFTKEKSLANLTTKSFFLIFLFCGSFFCHKGQAQVHIQSDTRITTSNNVQITLDNISLQNDGTFDGSNSTVTIQESNRSANLTFGGSGTTTLNHLNIDLQTQDILLTGDATVGGNLTFFDGQFDLNGNDVTLGDVGIILGENESSSFVGSSGGEIIKMIDLIAANTTNPGNIGAEITPETNMTNITIRRGHVVPHAHDENSCMSRYYNISSTDNAILNGTLRFHYLDTELVGIEEDELEQWRNDGSGWINQGFTSRNEQFNYVESTGINVLSLWTAADAENTVPVESVHTMLSSVTIYPNPAQDVLNIVMTGFENDMVKLTVLDISGKTIWAGEREVKEGITVLSLPEIRVLTPGSYFLNIYEGEHKLTSVRFVKVE